MSIIIAVLVFAALSGLAVKIKKIGPYTGLFIIPVLFSAILFVVLYSAGGYFSKVASIDRSYTEVVSVNGYYVNSQGYVHLENGVVDRVAMPSLPEASVSEPPYLLVETTTYQKHWLLLDAQKPLVQKSLVFEIIDGSF